MSMNGKIIVIETSDRISKYEGGFGENVCATSE